MTFEVLAYEEGWYRIDEVMLVMVPGRPTIFYATIKMCSFPTYLSCSRKPQYLFVTSFRSTSFRTDSQYPLIDDLSLLTGPLLDCVFYCYPSRKFSTYTMIGSLKSYILRELSRRTAIKHGTLINYFGSGTILILVVRSDSGCLTRKAVMPLLISDC